MLDKLIKILSAKQMFCFGITGSGNSGKLISDLIDNGHHYFDVNHEASAAIMSGIVSEISDTIGCSLSIKGPGLANMIPGIVNNYLENRFSISISEAYDQNKSGIHKNIKQYEMLTNIVRYQLSLSNVNLLEDILHKEKILGPVHINLCKDDRCYINDEIKPNSATIDNITSYTKIAVIFGKLCKNKIPSLQIPFFCTSSCKGNLYENDFFCGVYSGNGGILTHEDVLQNSDLIIGVDIKDCELLVKKNNIYNINYNTFQNLYPLLLEQTWGCDFIQEKNSIKDNFKKEEWIPASCFRLMNDLSYDYNIIVDTGIFCMHAEYFLRCNINRNFLGSLNGRYMGTSIPSAIGHGLVLNKPVFCAFGDGSTSYLNEIEILSRHKLPICFVLFSDGQYGTIVSSNTNIHQLATSKSFPWMSLFESVGVESYIIESLDSFHKKINSWNHKDSLFLFCKFNQEEYIASSDGIRISTSLR